MEKLKVELGTINGANESKGVATNYEGKFPRKFPGGNCPKETYLTNLFKNSQ